MPKGKSAFVEHSGRGDPHAYLAYGWSDAAANFLRKGGYKRAVFEGRWGDMTFLSAFSDQIEEIVVTNEDGLGTGIATLTKLKSLVIRNKLKKPIDLSSLTNLRHCDLWVSGATRQIIPSLPNLTCLRLRGWPDEDLKFLRGCPNLQELSLHSTHALSLSGIEALSSLQSLTLYDLRKLTDCSQLSVNGLTVLNVESCRAIRSYDFLSRLSALILLKIVSCAPLPSLRLLVPNDRLERVALGRTEVQDGCMTFAIQLPTLRLFVFADPPRNDATCEEIGKLLHMRAAAQQAAQA